MTPRFFTPAYHVFWAIFAPFMSRRIAKVHLSLPTPLPDTNTPLLLVANHCSWWDGFLLLHLHKALQAKAPYYTIMLERELKKHPYFRWMGCLGIEPGNSSTLRKLLHELKHLRQSSSYFSLCFYPQGRIWPAQKRPLGFHRGIEQIARTLVPLQIIPVALRIEPLNTCAPHAFVMAGSPITIDCGFNTSNLAHQLESAVTQQLDSLEQHLNQLGEATTLPIPQPPATCST